MNIDLNYVKEITVRKMSQPSKHLALLIFLSSLNVVVGTCHKACDSCVNDNCIKCDLGNYLESRSCYTCPVHCTSCNNSEVCYNCTEGYYGLSCDKNCSSMCINNTCDKDSGRCLYGCIDGYFLSGSSCYQCGAYCKTCANFSNNCLECKAGYYGPSCRHQCSRCKDGICTRDNCTYGCGDGFYRANEDCNVCNNLCTSCSIKFDNCHACVDGYFGPACQFECTDCSPCNQDRSCPKSTGQAPTSTTQQTSPSNESVTTTFSTTTKATTVLSQTSHDSTSILTTASSQTSHDSILPLDNTLIIYAAAGGGGGLVVIVLVIVVVVVCKRRGKAKQSDKVAENIDMRENKNYISAEGRQLDTVAENIDMTENENYISAEDIDEISRNSSNPQNDVKQNKQEDNDDLYSVPNKIHRPTMVTMETTSGQETEDSPSNISPTIPVKSNMYSDLI